VRLSNVENDVAEMKRNSGELFAKIDDLIAMFRDTRQKQIIMAEQIRRLEERIARLEQKNA